MRGGNYREQGEVISVEANMTSGGGGGVRPACYKIPLGI